MSAICPSATATLRWWLNGERRGMLRQTRAKVEAEMILGGKLSEKLPHLVEVLGGIEAAKRLGVRKSTIYYWLLSLGYEWRLVKRKPFKEEANT